METGHVIGQAINVHYSDFVGEHISLAMEATAIDVTLIEGISPEVISGTKTPKHQVAISLATTEVRV